ncbi:HRDC domain-containing protein [Puniceicoccaceae bacterium K14]|nr:HRDC domain-containing protein [Puniceicoccaceae bacterium K14]
MEEVHFTYIDTQSGVDDLCRHMKDHPEIALDSEADNLHHYETKLCLLQLRFDDTTYLLDVLADVQLDEFWKVLVDKHLIMHGSDFDLRLFQEFAGVKVDDLFDSMLASQLLGIKRIGLASLLEDNFQLKLPKDSQKSDWSIRPLTPKMLTYAANDVQYLFPLRDLLMKQICELGREEWLVQRCQQQICTAQSGFPERDEHSWRISRSDKLSAKAQCGLYELWHWREQLAMKLDRPPFKIIGNEYLITLAQAIADGKASEVLNGMAAGIQRRRKQGLTEAIERGSKKDPKTLPKRPSRGTRREPLSQEELDRQDSIKAFRDKIATELGIDSTLLATRSHVANIARDSKNLGELLPWQQDLLKPALNGTSGDSE